MKVLESVSFTPFQRLQVISGGVILLLAIAAFLGLRHSRMVSQRSVPLQEEQNNEESLAPARVITEIAALNPEVNVREGEFSWVATAPAKNWKKTELAGLEMEMMYPPTWSFPLSDRDHQGFCMKPQKSGSCQDVYPYISRVPSLEAFAYTSSLVQDHVFQPMTFASYDGAVIFPDDAKTEKPSAFLLRKDGELYIFVFDGEDPLQEQAFFSLTNND